MTQTTTYEGISRFYFYKLLKTIIEIGDLKNVNSKILDFGCGTGTLKSFLKGKDVIGFDIVKQYTEVKEWETVNFEYFVANQVFCCMSELELDLLIRNIKEINPDAKIIVGSSRLGLLNKIGMIFLNKKNAHSLIKINPKIEHGIISRYCKLLKKKNVYYLSDVYLYSFK